ncbi:hypothetical protein [Mycolicibacterium pallens]|uniref:Uncharacterized protein n=1 Tax=Mycolicibacterium pallens TaxID=370524 RepID=A0ABX8VP09_9MYCO|nr:hypothetical protein [Mycolicibacterium pallens]QYL19525.1 hypothetical protein K0O64_14170 [Mycolicibacterium pallens]
MWLPQHRFWPPEAISTNGLNATPTAATTATGARSGSQGRPAGTTVARAPTIAKPAIPTAVARVSVAYVNTR